MSSVYSTKSEIPIENTTTAVMPADTEQSVTATLPPPKIKKKRAPKHDFGDGRGRVFAHRHAYGKGWVEDTARVSDDVYVGPSAQVANYARVFGEVRLEAKSCVVGYATVFNRARLHNSARIAGHAIMNGGELFDRATISGDAEITNSKLYDVAVVRGSAAVKGCTFRGRTNVNGNVLMSAITTIGYVHIGGNASLFNSTLRGFVCVSDAAHIFGATLDNFFWQCSHFRSDEYMAKLDLIRPEYFLHIKDTASVQYGTRITVPVTVDGRSILHNCNISLNDLGLSHQYIFTLNESIPFTYDKPIIRNVVWRDAVINSRGGLDMLLAGQHNQQQATSIPAIRPEQMRSPYSLESLSRGRRVQPV